MTTITSAAPRLAPPTVSPPPSRVAAGEGVAVEAARPSLDTDHVDFQISLEMQGEPRKLQQVMRDFPGWSIGFSMGAHGPDCSHSDDPGYRRVKSPKLSIANGGLTQLKTVVSRLAEAGGVGGRTGAVRILLPFDCLDDKGWTHFMKTFLAHEDILYRLGQMGGAGREYYRKISVAIPPSTPVSKARPTSLLGWRNLLHHHNHGLNASRNGLWELRYLDSSNNADAVGANVELLLGMLKAASEERGKWQENRPATFAPPEVSRKRWNAFIDTVISDSDSTLKARLEDMFVNAGGKLERPALSGPARQAVTRLMERGFHIGSADGNPLASLEAIEAYVPGGTPLRVAAPEQPPVSFPSTELGSFALVECGQRNLCDQAFRDRFDAATALHARGFRFLNRADGETLSPLHAALMVADPRRVEIARPTSTDGGTSPTLPLATSSELGVTLEQILAVEQGDAEKYPPDLQRLLGGQKTLRPGEPPQVVHPSRQDLLSWNESLAHRVTQDPTFPYKDAVRAASRRFARDLGRIGGDDLASIEGRVARQARVGKVATAFGVATAIGGALAAPYLGYGFAVPIAAAGVGVSLQGAIMWRRADRLDTQLPAWPAQGYAGLAIQAPPARWDHDGLAPVMHGLEGKIQSDLRPFAPVLTAAHRKMDRTLDRSNGRELGAMRRRLENYSNLPYQISRRIAITSMLLNVPAAFLSMALQSWTPMIVTTSAAVAGFAGMGLSTCIGAILQPRQNRLEALEQSLQESAAAQPYRAMAEVMPSLQQLGL